MTENIPVCNTPFFVSSLGLPNNDLGAIGFLVCLYFYLHFFCIRLFVNNAEYWCVLMSPKVVSC